MEKFVEEQRLKMILVNKYLDEQKITSFEDRKFAYLRMIGIMGDAWSLSSEENIRKYYDCLPYHDEIKIYLDNKHIIIPKKEWTIEQGKKELAKINLDPTLLDINKSMKEKGLPAVELYSAASPPAEAAGIQ
jgi:hypothetical protein